MARPSTQSVEKAYLAAYDAEADGIFRYCLSKVSNREEALDITQDTFTKVWEYAQKGEAVTHWRGLLFRTANNLIIDYYRKKKSDSLDALAENTGYQPHEPGPHSDDKAEVARIIRICNDLPEEFRDPVYLRFVEGLMPQQIAEILDISVNLVSVRIHRGIEQVRKHMKTI